MLSLQSMREISLSRPPVQIQDLFAWQNGHGRQGSYREPLLSLCWTFLMESLTSKPTLCHGVGTLSAKRAVNGKRDQWYLSIPEVILVYAPSSHEFLLGTFRTSLTPWEKG
eukprot:1160948-Pelagomonas_calceolata.AAC.7